MRTLAIGDIHGCLAAFDHLIRFAKLTPQDTLIILGDVVDRGPDSRGVITRLIQLKSFCKVILLRDRLSGESVRNEATADAEGNAVSRLAPVRGVNSIAAP